MISNFLVILIVFLLLSLYFRGKAKNARIRQLGILLKTETNDYTKEKIQQEIDELAKYVSKLPRPKNIIDEYRKEDDSSEKREEQE